MNKTLITCHANADFDAFAGMLAARHLCRDADLLFPGTLETPLNKLYSSLDKTAYNFIEPHTINWDEYERLIIVDTRQASRLRHVSQLLKKENLKIEIWDHHPASSEDLIQAVLHYAPVGAVTSLLCMELRKNKIRLDAAEATLLGLGIYSDTGSFTYSSTTDADFQAAAWLLSQGMNVVQLSDMACQELTSLQVKALGELLANITTYRINNMEVALSEVDLEHYLGDVAFLVHKVMEMEKFDVFFVIARMADRIQVVGRSKNNMINVGEICSSLGGGGHACAASASIRFQSIAQVRDKLEHIINLQAHPEKTAQDFMTTPAIGIDLTATMHEADELMLHFGLKAIPVFLPSTRKCKGILEAQTAARACGHGLGNQPVSEYMRRHISVLPPDAKLNEVSDIIVNNGQRLVPIVKNDQVIGIITRTDLINIFASDTGSLAVIGKKKGKPVNISKLIRDRLDKNSRHILGLAGNLGSKLGLPVYIVGGFVRDLLIGYPNHDIDLVAEGNGITLARALAEELGGRVREHEKFLTSVVIYNDEKGIERHIDVATARLEYYESPAALPTIELSSIKRDLFRRDFSINALAVRLDGDHYGQLEDFFGGKNDVKEGLIRVLHTLSFVEDPTRCLRAVRFEQRYGFRLGQGTEKLIKNMLPLGLLEKLSQTRLFNEFRHICEEEKAPACFVRLAELGILKTLHPLLNINDIKKETLKRMAKIIGWYKLLFFESQAQPWICYYLALCRGMNYSDASQVYKALGLPDSKRNELMTQRELIRGLRQKLPNWLANNEKDCSSISQLCDMLQPVALEGLLYLMATDDKGMHVYLSRYITQWSREKADIDGNTLLKAGVERGPAIGQLLKEALAAKLNGIAVNPDEQLRHVLTKWRAEKNVAADSQ